MKVCVKTVLIEKRWHYNLVDICRFFEIKINDGLLDDLMESIDPKYIVNIKNSMNKRDVFCISKLGLLSLVQYADDIRLLKKVRDVLGVSYYFENIYAEDTIPIYKGEKFNATGSYFGKQNNLGTCVTRLSA